MTEKVIYNRFGKATYRLREVVFYDFMGKPRGFLVGKTVYDIRGTHRGFFVQNVLYDRGGRVIGYVAGARIDGLTLPEPEVPPVPYKDLPAPETPANCVDLDLPRTAPVWSIMRLENLLV